MPTILKSVLENPRVVSAQEFLYQFSNTIKLDKMRKGIIKMRFEVWRAGFWPAICIIRSEVFCIV